MGSDLTYYANAWPGYDNPCVACGAGCRAIDRFCSQCGKEDPLGPRDDPPYLFDDELATSDTVIAGDADELRPDATMVSTAETDPDASATAISGPPTARRSRRAGEAAATLERMLIPGNVFGRRYKIQRFLGAGAMGYVCSAIDSSIDEIVALKILSASVQEDPVGYERMKTELKLARKIRHRNVVQSFDLGFADGYPYISMEYIDADNLMKHLQRRSQFPETVALAIMRQVLRGLRAAHDLGIVHRDIKPENILLNKDGIAFITDFGIATTARRVRKREIAGTPDYMAPEQLRGEEVTRASDLYSCGVMLYRMVTGNLPFHATTISKTIEAHLTLPPDPIADDLDVTGETRDLIDALLRKNVADRPRDAGEVLDQVEMLLNAQKKTRSSSNRVTVLVADHDAHTVAFLRSVLETDGYRVVTTSNARDAVDVAFDQSPAVIFLDASIRGGFDLVSSDCDTEPGLIPGSELAAADGLGLLRIFAADAKLKSVPVVVMTDAPNENLRAVYDRCGAADFLVKPLAAADVTNTVRRLHVASMVT
jgi:serine/threonine protein kinase